MKLQILENPKRLEERKPIGVFLSSRNDDHVTINVRVNGQDFDIAWISDKGTMNMMTQTLSAIPILESAGFTLDQWRIRVNN